MAPTDRDPQALDERSDDRAEKPGIGARLLRRNGRAGGHSRGNGDERDTRLERRQRSREARLAIAQDAESAAEPPRRRLPRLPKTAATGSRPRPRLKKLRILLVLMGLAVLAFVSWVFGIMMAVAQDLPSLENRAQYAAAQNSIVYDRNGERLATLTNNEGRILLESDEIAPAMKEAVVAIEDQRFYEHRGIDFQGIGRALYQDILSGSAEQGASTITQQFVKNALEAQGSRTILQKLREAALAYHLERQWPKDKILTEYLNSIYFGEGAYGIEAAASTYFGAVNGCQENSGASCASRLTPWQAAMLAGLISSPSAYSPRANPDAATDRRNLVLERMSDLGYITPTEYNQFSQRPIPDDTTIRPPAENSAAPYFTTWLRQQLVDKYGAGEAFGGGLHVTSTLDLDLQRQAESIASSTLSGLGITSSLVVLDNDTGGVLAMVGGPDYGTSAFNLATQGHRQPGSSFKPFTLITALSQGHSPDEVFSSQPKQFPYQVRLPKKHGHGYQDPVNDIFDVHNYEDSYLGSASITSGTTYSDNSVYAELGLGVGVENVAEMAQKLGIETDLSTEAEYKVGDGDWSPYNPALILGGLEFGVTPLEMAHAFETVAQDGRRTSGTLAASDGGPVAIEKVLDSDGDPVPTNDGEDGINRVRTEQEIDPAVAQEAKSILATVVSSGTGTNAQTGEPTWGKTGTTDDNGDAWFVGSTPDVTVAVWVGHPESNQPMTTEYSGGPVDGGTFPAEIFASIVNAYTSIADTRKAAEKAADGSSDESGGYVAPPEPAPTETAPTEPAPTEAAPEPEADAAPQQQAPSAPTGGSGGSGTTGGGGVIAP